MPRKALLPYFFDPLQGHTPDQLLLLSKLHVLLFESLVITDSFLISHLFASTVGRVGGRSWLCSWIERGWIRVALRDNVESLVGLKDDFARKTENRSFTPFEPTREEGLRLYRSPAFTRYLRDLDACISAPGATASWNAKTTRVEFRKRMLESAQEDRAGLSPGHALAIWEKLDDKGARETHARTMYDEYARSLAAPQAKAVLAWVDRHYLAMLPNALDLSVSFPQTMLANTTTWDVLGELMKRDPLTDEWLVRGRDCALLSDAWLRKLRLSDIERLRQLPEFTEFTDARVAGDPRAIRHTLLTFLKAVGDESVRQEDPYIRTAEAIIRFKPWAIGCGLVGAAVGQVAPTLSTVIAISSGLFTVAAQVAETEQKKKVGRAVLSLEAMRPASTAVSLMAFCHGTAMKSTRAPRAD